MSILGSLAWILAGGAYAAGKGVQQAALEAKYPVISYEHNDTWYSLNWGKLNHRRQRELGKIYMTNRNEFFALAARVGDNCLSMDLGLGSGGVLSGGKFGASVMLPGNDPQDGKMMFNSFLCQATVAIASYEGWEADLSEYMIIHMKSNYDEPTRYEKEHYIRPSPEKLLTTNVDREVELWAKLNLAKKYSIQAERQYFTDYVEQYDLPWQEEMQEALDGNKRYSLSRGLSYTQAENMISSMLRREGYASYTFTPIFLRTNKNGSIQYQYGHTLLNDKVAEKEAELLTQYRDYPRQEELLRMLYYCKKGDKDAEREYYSKYYDIDEEDDIEFYISDSVCYEDNFGEDGLALFEFRKEAQSEGWVWDDTYPDALRKQQLIATYKCEVSYSDRTILPFNHKRQEDVYKAKFHATEHKDKNAQKVLLLFTGTRNSQRLSDDKFFALCTDCAKEEGWAWDDMFFTAEKCREVVRKCAAEEIYTPMVSNQDSD